jgi:sugar phosphate isomerase/epimerase
MGKRKIGVRLASFKVSLKESIQHALECGVDGVEPSAFGELAPENISQSGRRDFLHQITSKGLIISALSGNLGRPHFISKEGLEERVERTKRILDLSMDLKAGIVCTHIGHIPEDQNAPEWEILLHSLGDIGAYAEKIGAFFACETGPESPELMKAFLEKLARPHIGINYDPANLVMRGFEPIPGVYTLSRYIVHTHAKDAIGKEKGGPNEVPVGQGEVNFPEYIKALDEIGYSNFYSIERERGDDRVGDIHQAVEFLRKF